MTIDGIDVTCMLCMYVGKVEASSTKRSSRSSNANDPSEPWRLFIDGGDDTTHTPHILLVPTDYTGYVQYYVLYMPFYMYYVKSSYMYVVVYICAL